MLNLTVISQEKKLLETDCLSLSVPTKSGIITILPEHAALFSLLHYGEVVIRTEDNKESYLLVSGGFVSVKKDKVTLLIDFGVRSEDIDEKAVSEAKARAEEAMKNNPTEEVLEKSRAELVRMSLQLEHVQRRGVKR